MHIFIVVIILLLFQLFISPEDAASGGKVGDDQDIARIKRAHMNDIENIFPFVIVAALYLTTGPTAFAANTAFKVFTAARYIHSFVYIWSVSFERFRDF